MNASSCLNVASGVSVLYDVKFVTSWSKFGVTSIFLIESTDILNLGDFFSRLCLIYLYDVDNERLLKKQKQKETTKRDLERHGTDSQSYFDEESPKSVKLKLIQTFD